MGTLVGALRHRSLSLSPLPEQRRRSGSRNGWASASPRCSTAPLIAQKKKVLVPIGIGTEEMEAVILVSLLRQAGAHVVVASVEAELEVEASSGTRLVADTCISNCSHQIFDLVALPGGMPGAARLRDCHILRNITTQHVQHKRLYAAISAAPAVTLQSWRLLGRKLSTCHPAFMHQLPTFWAVKSNIQISGQLTTSRGPGTAFPFVLSLVHQLLGDSLPAHLADTLLICADNGRPRKEEFNKVEWSVECIPRVLIPVANGSEEIEVVTIVDILRRAKMDVVIASVEKSMQIVAARNTRIVADKFIVDAATSLFDMIILPGGVTGTKRLSKSIHLKKLLKEQYLTGRILGAISSASAVLQKQGLLKCRRATIHPSIVDKLTSDCSSDAGVVIDGKVITSEGLATAADFALAIISKFLGNARARSVAEGLVLDYPWN